MAVTKKSPALWEERRCVYRMGSRQLRSLAVCVLKFWNHDIHILQFQQSFPNANVAIFGFASVLHWFAGIHLRPKVKLERRLFAESVLVAYRYQQWKGSVLVLLVVRTRCSTQARFYMMPQNDDSPQWWFCLEKRVYFLVFRLHVVLFSCTYGCCTVFVLWFLLGCLCWKWTLFFSPKTELWSRNCHVLAVSEYPKPSYRTTFDGRHEGFYLPWTCWLHS